MRSVGWGNLGHELTYLWETSIGTFNGPNLELSQNQISGLTHVDITLTVQNKKFFTDSISHSVEIMNYAIPTVYINGDSYPFICYSFLFLLGLKLVDRPSNK